MKNEVRFTVSDEAEQVLQEVAEKLHLSRNQAAHYCMAVGAAAINATIPKIDFEKFIEKLVERVAGDMTPGIQSVVNSTVAFMMQPETLKLIADDSQTLKPK